MPFSNTKSQPNVIGALKESLDYFLALPETKIQETFNTIILIPGENFI